MDLELPVLRFSVLSALALISGASVAQAQGAGIWSGFCAGLTYSDGSAFQQYDTSNTSDLEGNGAGVMLGDNPASGLWVFGGELAYSKTKLAELRPDTQYAFTPFQDLKARAGYAAGDALIYGAPGTTFTKWQEGTGNGRYGGDGQLYGIGLDYKAPPEVFVGAEYLRRNVTSEWTTAGDMFDVDPSTLTLRDGLSFEVYASRGAADATCASVVARSPYPVKRRS